MATTGANVGAETLPFGLGFHPYLTAGDRPRRHRLAAAAGHARLVLDERGLPTGEVRSVLGTEYDFTDRAGPRSGLPGHLPSRT